MQRVAHAGVNADVRPLSKRNDGSCRFAASRRSVLKHDISSWCSSRRQQLNSEKTELIWFGSRHTLQNVNHEDLTLQLGSTIIEPARIECDLGVLLDDELSMKQHISKVPPPASISYGGCAS